MATLTGKYASDTAQEPRRIDLAGDHEEISRVFPHVLPHYRGFRVGPTQSLVPPYPVVDETEHINVPANREAVREMARHVEIQCDDQRLIDWMKAGDA